MNAYADTNFLTRCYLLVQDLPAPDLLLEQLCAAGSALPVFWLHRWEITNAFEQHVYAARMVGQVRVTREMAAAAHARFRDDCGNPASLLRIVSVSMADLERQFGELCLRHTARHGFRTYDLLHVAAALLLGCDRFWSFDAKASKLAALEGLATLVVKTQ